MRRSWSLRATMSCSPQPLRRVQRIDIEVLPPRKFVAAPMEFAMMKPAKRDSEFITDFATKRALLCELEMVRVRRAATASQTGLSADKFQMISIS